MIQILRFPHPLWANLL